MFGWVGGSRERHTRHPHLVQQSSTPPPFLPLLPSHSHLQQEAPQVLHVLQHLGLQALDRHQQPGAAAAVWGVQAGGGRGDRRVGGVARTFGKAVAVRLGGGGIGEFGQVVWGGGSGAVCCRAVVVGRQGGRAVARMPFEMVHTTQSHQPPPPHTHTPQPPTCSSARWRRRPPRSCPAPSAAPAL